MRQLNKHGQIICLISLLLVGALLRFVRVGVFPPGLTSDEAAISFDAWGLSIDGKDQWGNSFPLEFVSLGDGKLPFTHYLLAVFFKLFGFHIYGIRYLSAGFGVMLILGNWLLVKRLFSEWPEAHVAAAALTAFSPYGLHFSRFGLESGIAACLLVYGMVFLMDKRYIRGVLFFCISVYTYHSSLVMAPVLLMLGLGLLDTNVRYKRILAAGLFIVLLIPYFKTQFRSGWTRAYQTVSIPVSGQIALERVRAHFSADFWIGGIQPNHRQSVKGYFVLLLIEVPLLIFGVFTIFRLEKRKALFVFIWLASGLLPSFIGNPSPHTIRAFSMFPALVIIEAIGLSSIMPKKKWITRLILIAYLINWVSFWQFYTTKYPAQAATDYGYGYAQVMKYLKKFPADYTYVISPFLGQPYIYTLLYWKISPPEYRAGGLANMRYRSVAWPENQTDTIYAASADEIPPNDPRVLTVINYPDDERPLWVIAR